MERKKLTCIRFDTCYCGRYFEIFYVFLKIHKNAKTPPSIVAHTLPSFLPVEEWEKEYLVSDIRVLDDMCSLRLVFYSMCFSSFKLFYCSSSAISASRK